MHHRWEGELKFEFVRGAACAARAEEFVRGLKIPAPVRAYDRLLRFARRCRRRLKARPPEDFSWWAKIVAQSRPYSRLDLG